MVIDDSNSSNARPLERLPIAFAVSLLASTFGLGCSNSPQGVSAPEIDAYASSSEVFRTYDADGDGLLDVKELSSCVGLEDKVPQYDLDRDGKISSEELTSRIQSWTEDGLGMTSVPCSVLFGGRPLGNATVILQPVDFLGDVLLTARGVTSPDGRCSISVDPSELPKELSRVSGVQPGMYKVMVTHDRAKIPTRYNVDTTLSVEVSHEAIRPIGISLVLERD